MNPVSIRDKIRELEAALGPLPSGDCVHPAPVSQQTTFVELEISAAAFEEIREKLAAAGCYRCFNDVYGKAQLRLDMQGIALKSGAWSAVKRLPVDSDDCIKPGNVLKV